ncbi:MAG TPA: hypothetical protein VFN78_09350 [Ktedonobacterales bacterium]|nr:hypothetical protein [Ktedonobacterales bacterium]
MLFRRPATRIALSSFQRRLAVGVCAVFAIIALVAGCTQKATQAWLYQLGTSQPYFGANEMSLRSVSMVSPDDGWAVGGISGDPTTLLMQYSRGQWTVLPKPAGLQDHSDFAAVSMVSHNDGWALASMDIPLGDRYNSFRPGSVFLHYDGSAWRIASPVFPLHAEQTTSALLMLSSTDGWATSDNETLRYDGVAWREVTALTDKQWGGGSSIAATGPNNVWIARFTGDILHFDGSAWTEQRITVPFGQQWPGAILLHGIAMLSPHDGFAVGGIGNSTSGVIVRYLGDRWAVQQTVGENLNGVTIRSPTDGWAVGGAGGVYHYQAGAWTKADRPTSLPLYGVDSLHGSGDAWAVGLDGVILSYHDGGWRQETNVVWSREARAAWK